jgi:peptide/nickel transport system permease protein
MAFAYYIPLFPLVGGASGSPANLGPYLLSVVQHAFLPALSLILLGTAFRFIIARALASTVIASDAVTYAEIAGLPRRRVIFGYVLRNSLLPQVTDLALSLGALFEGALITEFVFSYPGIGYRLYTAILQSDFNMIMGVTIFSIVGIATAALIIDLLYPLFDPRVRYR